MTVTKKRRKKILLCGSAEPLVENDTQPEATPSENKLIILEQNKEKAEKSIWTRFTTFLRDRFSTMAFIRTQRPLRKKSSSRIGKKPRGLQLKKKPSILPVVSLPAISEINDEESNQSIKSNKDTTSDEEIIVDYEYIKNQSTNACAMYQSVLAFPENVDHFDGRIIKSHHNPRSISRTKAFLKREGNSFGRNRVKDELSRLKQKLGRNKIDILKEWKIAEEICLNSNNNGLRETPETFNKVTKSTRSLYRNVSFVAEKGRNVNAWGGEEDTELKKSKPKASKKSPIKRRVTFNEKSIEKSENESEQSSLIHKELYQKEQIINTEKIHPATSKRKEYQKPKRSNPCGVSSSLEELLNDSEKKFFAQDMITELFQDEAKSQSEGKKIHTEGFSSSLKDAPIIVKPYKGKGKGKKSKSETKKETSPKMSRSTDEDLEALLAESKDYSKMLFEAELKKHGQRQERNNEKDANVDTGKKVVDDEEQPKNENESSEGSSCEELDLDHIRNAAKSLVTNSTMKALDFIDGLDGIKKSLRESGKYQSNLSKIKEEKEPHHKRKQILQKIYGEVNTDNKTSGSEESISHGSSGHDLIESLVDQIPPLPPNNNDKRQREALPKNYITRNDDEKEVKQGYDYQTTDDDLDCDDGDEKDLPRPAKNNTVIIPKPRIKHNVPDVIADSSRENVREETRIKLCNQNNFSPRDSEPGAEKEYTTCDLINDIDSCLAEVEPPLVKMSKMRGQRTAALAPNPFPVDKNNLIQVQPPKSEKPKYKRKRLYNPLLAGVEDHPAVQPINANQEDLGKLKEVKNRQEPTPEVYLKRGQEKRPQEREKRSQDTKADVFKQPMGALLPKGKVHLSQYPIIESVADNKERLLSCEHEDPTSKMSESSKQKYTKMKTTFRARTDNLPDAQFWTSLAMDSPQPRQIFEESQSPTEEKCGTPLPMAPIGCGKNDGYYVGVTNSEADLNKLFFHAIASKPQFYKTSNDGSTGKNVSSQSSNSSTQEDNTPSPEENLQFFQKVSKDSSFWKRKHSDQTEVPKFLPKRSGQDSSSQDSQENLSFFKKVSQHEFLNKKSNNIPRSYFNEPPLGSEMCTGRNHTKGIENIEFFLNVSRNPTAFYHMSNSPTSMPGESKVPQGYSPNSGYIPDDPKNYVDLETAGENLMFFQNITKSSMEKKDKKKKKKKEKRECDEEKKII